MEVSKQSDSNTTEQFYPDQNGEKEHSNTSMSDAEEIESGELPEIKNQIRAVDLDDMIDRLINYEHYSKDRSLEEKRGFKYILTEVEIMQLIATASRVFKL